MIKLFSDYCYSGVMDSDFKVLWSDNCFIFRRLSIGSKKLVKYLKNNNLTEPLYHNFRAEGVWYRACIEQLSNNTYMCRISRQISDEELQLSEITKYTESCRDQTYNIYHMLKSIEEYVKETGYVSDKFHEEFKQQQLEVGCIYSDCYNVLNAFNDQSNSEFIPIAKYIIRSWDVAYFVTRKMKKAFNIGIDIVFPYAKIDYSKFELALFNIIKIVLIYTARDLAPLISIKTVDKHTIEVSADFPHCDDYKIENCSLEIRAIKYIFKQMGGSFELHEYDGRFKLLGSLKTDFSLDENDIADGRDLVCIVDAELVRRKRESDHYIRIYENVSKKKLSFASEVKEFSDIGNSDVDFAEIFFSKAILNDSK